MCIWAALRAFTAAHFEQGGFKVAGEALDHLLALGQGHPYYTQLLCHLLWERASENRAITPAQVEEALTNALRREEGAFIAIWDTLSRKQRQLLAALSRERAAQIFSAAFLKRHGLGSAASVQKALAALIDRELVDRENGGYTVVDLLFRRWIAGQGLYRF